MESPHIVSPDPSRRQTASRRVRADRGTFTEHATGPKENLLERWRTFTTGRIGRLLVDHTPLVRLVAAPQATGWQAQAPAALLLLLCLVTLVMRLPVVAFLLFLAAVVAATAGVVFWWAYRDSEQRRRDDLKTRRQLLSQAGVASHLGARAVSKSAEHAEPLIRLALRQAGVPDGEPIPARWMGVRIGASHGVGVWAWAEQAVYILGPARSGKSTSLVIPLIMEAPGAVVTTSSRRDVVDATWKWRQDGWQDASRHQCEPSTTMSGHDKPLSFSGSSCWLFDPMDVASRQEADGALPPAIQWNPISRCDRPEVARSCAESMVATVGISGDNASWAHTAVDIVQALLLAAALEGKNLADVYGWSMSANSAQAAATILQRHPECPVAGQWAKAILTLTGEDQRIVGSKMLGVTGAFSALSLPQVRRALCPIEETFDMDRFVRGRDTVYLLSELKPAKGRQAATGAGAFTAMFLTQVRDAARRAASGMPAGRVQPPVAFVLDEIANIEPWNELPQLFTAGTGEGIWPIAVFQSRQQAQDAYGKSEGQMWDSSHKIILGGLSIASELQEISTLSGKRKVARIDESHALREGVWGGFTSSRRLESVPVISPDEVRELPRGLALVLHSSHRPAIMELDPGFSRPYEPFGTIHLFDATGRK